MDKRKRIAKLARSIRNRIEHDNMMWVSSEPKLTRTGTLYYKRNRAGDIEWMPMDQRLGRWPMVLKGASAVRVTRLWQVQANNWCQQYENLACAQAAREGLNYHYARWLMARGTGAAEYA